MLSKLLFSSYKKSMKTDMKMMTKVNVYISNEGIFLLFFVQVGHPQFVLAALFKQKYGSFPVAEGVVTFPLGHLGHFVDSYVFGFGPQSSGC